MSKNQIIVYDIYTNELCCQTSLNPPKDFLEYIYEDDAGYNCMTMCQTSEIVEERKMSWLDLQFQKPDLLKQTVKFQFFTLCKEKLGILRG